MLTCNSLLKRRPIMAIATTSAAAQAWRPDAHMFEPGNVIPEALINQITTPTTQIDGDAVAVRIAVVPDDVADLVPEGTLIPLTDPELAEVLLMTIKVGKILRVSAEQFKQPGTSETLAKGAARAIITKADDVLINQAAPIAPETTPPAGLLAQGVTSAGAIGANLDVLIDALAGVQAAGGHPSHFVLAPDTWAGLRKLKTETGSALGILGAGAKDAAPVLLGVPLLVNKAVPAGTGLLVDKTDIVSAIGPVAVTQSDQAYFVYDSYGLRITFRFGAKVVHPERHAKFTLT